MRKFLIALAATLLWLPRIAPADVRAEQGWIRATAPGAAMAAGYATLRNTGTTPELLVGVSTPVAARTELHESRVVGGMETMRPVPRLEIAAGGSVTFAPAGLHLMLSGLTGPLVAGAVVPFEFRFASGRRVTLRATVLPIGAIP